jgi:UDP-glucose 4-epimerase
MKVLVTGGAGYIGSHTCLWLLEAGYEVVVLDNLCNSSELALQRVQQIAGRSIDFVRGNILDRDDVERALAGGVEAIIHFAALKAVGESCSRPLEYFNTNVAGTINLLQAMDRMGVRKFVFSSSAAV